MKTHGKHVAESKQGMGSRMLATALTAALTMSSVPMTALAMTDEGAEDEGSDALQAGYDKNAALAAPGGAGAAADADDGRAPDAPPAADADDATSSGAQQPDGAPADDELAAGEGEAADAADADADGAEASEDAGAAEAAALVGEEDGDEGEEDGEEEAQNAWMRPAEGASIPLTRDNSRFVSETGVSTYYTYPVMQACTSTLIDLPQITAHGTKPASGVDFAAEQGVAVADIVAADVDRTDAKPGPNNLDPSYGDSFGNHYVFWKASLLSSAVGSSQALGNNSSQIKSGQNISHIRYNASADEGRGSWECTADGSTWTAFEVGSSTNQLVFYYKQIAFLDENVNLTNDNDYRRADAWKNNTGYGRDNQDAVCFLYQLYDENGNKIDMPASQAYYFSHANPQEVVVSLSSKLTDKYEIAKVSWDNYQEYIAGSKLYTETCPDFEIPQKFSMLANEEASPKFTIDLTQTACEHEAHSACTAEHRGLYGVGIMVRGIQGEQSITVNYWGGKTEDSSVQLGSQTVSVASSGAYDWDAAGYETAKELTVKSVLSYNGDDVEQTVPLTLPEAYAGCYDNDPYARVLEGNVLNLYFDADVQDAQISSDPVVKVYDGEALLPAEPVIELPDGFTYTLDEGALSGSQTTVGESEPVLDMTKVHIFKGEGGPEVTNIFDIGQDLGSMEVVPREIAITPEDAEKTYGEPDPAFAAPAVELLSDDDGKPAIVEGDDLDITVFRADGSEDVKRDADGNVVAYPDVIEVGYTDDPNYRIVVDTADFTIWPQSIDPEDAGNDREDGRYLAVVADPLADIPYNGQDSIPVRVPVMKADGAQDAPQLKLNEDFVAVYDGDTTNVTERGVYVMVAGKGNYTGTLTIRNDAREGGESYRITPAPAVIYVDDAVKYVGEADEDATAGRVFGGTVEGLIGDDSLGDISYERTNAGIEDAGVYEDVLTAEVADANANYTYTVVNGTFTILPLPGEGDPVPPTPTDPEGPEAPDGEGEDPVVDPDPEGPDAPEEENSVIIFGSDGTPHTDANDLGGLGYHKTYDGHGISPNAAAKKPGSTLLYSVNGGLTWTPENPRFTEAGDYKVSIKATNPDYEDTAPVEVDMTIAKRPVTIVVDSVSKQYGQTDPAFTGTLPELVNEGDLGEISFSRTNADEEVGTYPQAITAHYTENPNYEVTISRGTLHISPTENEPFLGGILGGGETIGDDGTPLASRFAPSHDHGCWVHWWMILGLLLTIFGTAGAVLRRIKCIRRIGSMEGDVMESADLASASRS